MIPGLDCTVPLQYVLYSTMYRPVFPSLSHFDLLTLTTFTSCRVASVDHEGAPAYRRPRGLHLHRRRPSQGKSAASEPARSGVRRTKDSSTLSFPRPSVPQAAVLSTLRPSLSKSGCFTLCNRCSQRLLAGLHISLGYRFQGLVMARSCVSPRNHQSCGGAAQSLSLRVAPVVPVLVPPSSLAEGRAASPASAFYYGGGLLLHLSIG